MPEAASVASILPSGQLAVCRAESGGPRGGPSAWDKERRARSTHETRDTRQPHRLPKRTKQTKHKQAIGSCRLFDFRAQAFPTEKLPFSPSRLLFTFVSLKDVKRESTMNFHTSKHPRSLNACPDENAFVQMCKTKCLDFDPSIIVYVSRLSS